MIISYPIVSEEAELGPFHPITLCAQDDQRDLWTAEATVNLGIEGLQYHSDQRLLDYNRVSQHLLGRR
jgi:hypothetical protein